MNGGALSPMDLAMDLCSLVIVQLVFDRIHLKRLILSEILLCVCTIFSMCLGKPALLVQAAVILACGALATGERRPIRIIEAAACLACTFGAAAGLAMLSSDNAVLYAPAGAMLLLLILRRRRNVHLRWNIELFVEKDGTSDYFPALIDTGNRLCERRSGLPVLIVESAAMPHLSALVDKLPKSQTRPLSFGVLGGSGEMRCFKPDKIEISAAGIHSRQAPDCWVAVFPGRIPGTTRALAPPEFVEAIQNGGNFYHGMKHMARRLYHGVFKRKAIHLWTGGSNPEGFRLLHRRERPFTSSADAGGRDFAGSESQFGGFPGSFHDD